MAQQQQKRSSRESGIIELTRDERGQRLYNDLLEADKPIRNLLIRLNRILKDKFGDTDLRTCSSCSGHVQENGSIAYGLVIPELFPEGRYPKREMFPHLYLDASCKTTSSKRREEIASFLSTLLKNAVNRTNAEVGRGSAKLKITADPEPEEGYFGENLTPEEFYPFLYRVFVRSKSAFGVLQCLWRNVEAELEQYDSIKSRTVTSIQDFYPSNGPLLPGQIRPT